MRDGSAGVRGGVRCLKGDPEAEAAQHELLGDYVKLMMTALQPHSTLKPKALRLRCLALLGAAEALAVELDHGRITTGEAVAAFAGLLR